MRNLIVPARWSIFFESYTLFLRSAKLLCHCRLNRIEMINAPFIRKCQGLLINISEKNTSAWQVVQSNLKIIWKKIVKLRCLVKSVGLLLLDQSFKLLWTIRLMHFSLDNSLKVFRYFVISVSSFSYTSNGYFLQCYLLVRKQGSFWNCMRL